MLGLVLVAFTGAVLYRLGQLGQRLDDQQAQLARLAAAVVVTSPEPTTVQMVADPMWKSFGRTDAPVTVVEFTDYECPFCKQFHSAAFAQIVRDYVESGRVRWVSRDLPLDIHPYAGEAAEAAHCAADQGKYWELRDALLGSDTLLTRGTLTRAAQRLSLNLRRFQHCLDSEKYRSWVANDAADAAVLQITGTPAFVIAKSDADVLTGALLIGNQSYDVFRSAIDVLLNDSGRK
ncbi:MAG: DsbA family protein [Gemmatimonadota bacterium]